MKLIEAYEQISQRLDEVHGKVKEAIPEYYEALDIARKAIQSQILLAEMISDFDKEKGTEHERDFYSWKLVYELLTSVYSMAAVEIDTDHVRSKDDATGRSIGEVL